MRLTAEDVAWLTEIDRAMAAGMPAQVVAAAQYQAVVDGRDAAVSRIHRMRANRRRLWARYRRLRRRLRVTRWAVVAIAGVWILWKW